MKDGRSLWFYSEHGDDGETDDGAADASDSVVTVKTTTVTRRWRHCWSCHDDV